MLVKLKYGVGINDYDGRITDSNLKIYPFAQAWDSMIKRAYSTKYHLDKPSYKDVTVCKEWLSLSNFKEWHDLHYKEGCQLDKDLRVVGATEYGPDTCSYVPSRLNSLFIDRKRDRGSLPLGVYLCKGRYTAQLSKSGKREWLGYHDTVEEAYEAYIFAKLIYSHEVIESFRGEVSDTLLDTIYTNSWDLIVS